MTFAPDDLAPLTNDRVIDEVSLTKLKDIERPLTWSEFDDILIQVENALNALSVGCLCKCGDGDGEEPSPVIFPKIITQPMDVTLDEENELSVQATVKDTDYIEWQYQDPALVLQGSSGFYDIGLMEQWSTAEYPDGVTVEVTNAVGGVDNTETTTAMKMLNAKKSLDGFKFRVKVKNALEVAYSNEVTLTVEDVAPVWITQPVATLTTTVYDIWTMNVEAAGAGRLDYQWQKYNGSQWVDLSGQVANFLSMQAEEVQEGRYRVKATSSGITIISTECTLTVDPLINLGFSQQPQSKTVTEGNSVSLTCSTIGAESIQWKYRQAGSSSWGNPPPDFSGVDTETLVLNNATSAYNNAEFKVVLSADFRIKDSDTVVLTVEPAPDLTTDYIISQPIASYGDNLVRQSRAIPFDLTHDTESKRRDGTPLSAGYLNEENWTEEYGYDGDIDGELVLSTDTDLPGTAAYINSIHYWRNTVTDDFHIVINTTGINYGTDGYTWEGRSYSNNQLPEFMWLTLFGQKVMLDGLYPDHRPDSFWFGSREDEADGGAIKPLYYNAFKQAFIDKVGTKVGISFAEVAPF